MNAGTPLSAAGRCAQGEGGGAGLCGRWRARKRIPAGGGQLPSASPAIDRSLGRVGRAPVRGRLRGGLDDCRKDLLPENGL
eukprot:374337-Pyramimonas_sp.AAC.1